MTDSDFRENYMEALKEAEATLGKLTELVLETGSSGAPLQKRVDLVAEIAWDARPWLRLADIQTIYQLSSWLLDRADENRQVSKVYKYPDRSCQIMVPAYLLAPGRGARLVAFTMEAVRSSSPAYRAWEF